MTRSSDGGDGMDDDPKEGQDDEIDDYPSDLANKSGTYRVMRAHDGGVILREEEDRFAEKFMQFQEIYNRRAKVRNSLRSVFERNTWLVAKKGEVHVPKMSARDVAEEDSRLHHLFNQKYGKGMISSPFSRTYVEDVVMYYEEYSKYIGEKLAFFVRVGKYDRVASLLKEARKELMDLPLYPLKAIVFFQDVVCAKMMQILPRLAESNPLLYLQLRDEFVKSGLLKNAHDQAIGQETGPSPGTIFAHEFLFRCLQSGVTLYVEMASILDKDGLVDMKKLNQSPYVQGPLQQYLVEAMKRSPDWYISMRDWFGELGLIDSQSMDKDPEIVDAAFPHFHEWKNRSPVSYDQLCRRWVEKGLREPAGVAHAKVQNSTLFERVWAWGFGASLPDVDHSSEEEMRYRRLFSEYLEHENEKLEQIKEELEEQVKRFFELFPQFCVKDKRE